MEVRMYQQLRWPQDAQQSLMLMRQKLARSALGRYKIAYAHLKQPPPG